MLLVYKRFQRHPLILLAECAYSNRAVFLIAGALVPCKVRSDHVGSAACLVLSRQAELPSRRLPSRSYRTVVVTVRNTSRKLPIWISSPLDSTAESTNSRLT